MHCLKKHICAGKMLTFCKQIDWSTIFSSKCSVKRSVEGGRHRGLCSSGNSFQSVHRSSKLISGCRNYSVPRLAQSCPQVGLGWVGNGSEIFVLLGWVLQFVVSFLPQADCCSMYGGLGWVWIGLGHRSISTPESWSGWVWSVVWWAGFGRVDENRPTGQFWVGSAFGDTVWLRGDVRGHVPVHEKAGSPAYEWSTCGSR